jgi:pimeloyl-ACP methyl ester carboxylesterase
MRICSRAPFAILAIVSMFYGFATGQPARAQSSDGRDIQASYAYRFSRYYLPYAIQASVAYKSVGELNGMRGKLNKENYPADAEYAVQIAIPSAYQELRLHAQEVFKHWRYEFGSDVPLTCIDPSDSACQAEFENRGRAFGSGPVFQVWSRARSLATHDVCNEVSIAFRGTVGSLWGDAWFSNANRWGSPYDDYYYQLRRNISGIMKSIPNRVPCYKRANPPLIVTTGHSLGGGLAQFVALATKRGDLKVAKVFAFDSSPVTGEHLLDPQLMRENAKGLTVDHIYETGEPLYRLRHSPAQQFPKLTSACDPLVREVEVDAARGKTFDLHGIELLATKLTDLSYNEGNPTNYRAPATRVNGCDVRYYDGAGELVASADGRQKQAAFTPNYGGYADQFGVASYPVAAPRGQIVAKLHGRKAVLIAEKRMKDRPVENSYQVVARVEGSPAFTPLPRAE